MGRLYVLSGTKGYKPMDTCTPEYLQIFDIMYLSQYKVYHTSICKAIAAYSYCIIVLK